MSSGPKNFSEALEELGKFTDAAGEELKQKFKPQFDDLRAKVKAEGEKARDRVEAQVKENPWIALGAIGFVFFLLGYLFGGRGGRRD